MGEKAGRAADCPEPKGGGPERPVSRRGGTHCGQGGRPWGKRGPYARRAVPGVPHTRTHMHTQYPQCCCAGPCGMGLLCAPGAHSRAPRRAPRKGTLCFHTPLSWTTRPQPPLRSHPPVLPNSLLVLRVPTLEPLTAKKKSPLQASVCCLLSAPLQSSPIQSFTALEVTCVS